MPSRMIRERRDIIEIGRRLIDAKGIAGHGGWLPGLDDQFGWTARTAQRFMSVGELANKSDTCRI